MTILEQVAPRLGRAYKAAREWFFIECKLPELREQFTNNEYDFVMPLGDNWLATWNWAWDLERRYNIDPQKSLKVAYDEIFAEHNR